VTRNTREAVYLCEAAGYDVILIETVGVGQSETAVQSMVDFFMTLQIVGGGDDLQAIKRGIYEHIDLLVVHKADQDQINQARKEAANFKKMFSLFPPKESQWIPQAMSCSSIDKTGIDQLWETLLEYKKQTQSSGYFQKKRTDQKIAWYQELQQDQLNRFLRTHPKLKIGMDQIQAEMIAKNHSPLEASKQLEQLLTALFSKT
jgi:LAO/AO transport system kinase